MAPALPQNWSYDSFEDAMGGALVRQARVKSSNQVEFDFPYAGPQRATLGLRTHPRHGKDALFAIEKGSDPVPLV